MRVVKHLLYVFDNEVGVILESWMDSLKTTLHYSTIVCL